VPHMTNKNTLVIDVLNIIGQIIMDHPSILFSGYANKLWNSFWKKKIML